MDKKPTDREVCPYCHQDNEGYVKMFGRFYLRKDHFNGWNLYAGKGKPLPIKFCPMCGRILKIEQTQVNSIQDDFCGVPCKFMEEKINRLQAENEQKDKNYIELLKTSSERAVIIGEQGAEIERLNKEISDREVSHINLYNETKAEIERLNTLIAETNEQRGAVIHAITHIDEVKAEAYKECIEKVKEEILFYSNMTEVYEFLDNLLKELVDNNG